MKIVRLGVNVCAQHRHIGTDILDFVKQSFITNNRTGCCFVTVDALQFDSLEAYYNSLRGRWIIYPHTFPK